MLRLPAILMGDLPARLPLNNEAAVCVANALLCDEPAERERQLRELLPGEPSLVLWCACRMRTECISIAEMSAWLSHYAVTELQWDGTEESDSPDGDSGRCLQRWADLAASSVAATLEIRDDEGETAFISALLSRAADWLATSDSGNRTNSSPGDIVLPPWLADAIAKRRTLANGTKLRVTSADFPRLNAIRQRWLASVTKPAICLPTLMRRLANLKELETSFATKLESEKLASLKELAYGASHEINNPLANIATRAQTLLRDERDPERRRKLAIINAQAFRAHEMISDMMLFARPPQLRPEAIDFVSLIATVVAELAADAELQGTAIGLGAAPTRLEAIVDREQMSVVVKAICRNALEAIGQGGRVTIELQETIAGQGTFNGTVPHESHVAIRVRDTGPGISPEVRRHLFDPFYSGREAGRGLGFGLAKSWRIVTLHGGQIEVESELGHGATFIVRLPCSVCEHQDLS